MRFTNSLTVFVRNSLCRLHQLLGSGHDHPNLPFLAGEASWLHLSCKVSRFNLVANEIESQIYLQIHRSHRCNQKSQNHCCGEELPHLFKIFVHFTEESLDSHSNVKSFSEIVFEVNIIMAERAFSQKLQMSCHSNAVRSRCIVASNHILQWKESQCRKL